MRLEKLLERLPVYETMNVDPHLEINAVQMDHREIKHGDLFVCIKGFTVDGHQFAAKAVENGAVAIVAERNLHLSVPTIIVPDTKRALAMLACTYYNYPTQQFKLIGITGTNGKTTITYLLEKIYATYGKKTGIIGTIQMKIGDETYPIINTTPDALRLQQSFAQMVEQDVEVCMMEVSSHALDLGRVYGTDFDIALFTNLSQDHLDYHKDMDDYLRAKTLLFTGLGNGYNSHTKKFAILNADDPSCGQIARSTAQPIITYGLQDTADIYATNIKLTLSGTTFDVVTPQATLQIHSQLIGKFNIYNMLAAISVAYVEKIPFTVIKEALENISGVAGRFERVDVGQDFAVIVDYAHTPDSLQNVLETIREFAEQRVYVVVGTGGDRDRTKRPLMADIATHYSDLAIFTSDNPRTEDPYAILDDMTRDLKATNYEVIENRRAAIQRAVALAEKGDIILIAGKGHETYQEINGVRYDFDDRIVAREAIEEKGFSNEH